MTTENTELADRACPRVHGMIPLPAPKEAAA